MDREYEGNVMQFNIASQNWDYAGGIKGQSTISFIKAPNEGCYKLIGKRNSDGTVIISSSITPKTKLNKATESFINFKDGNIHFGIKLQNSEIASLFYQTLETIKATPVTCENIPSEPPRSQLPVPPPPARVSSPPTSSTSLQAPPCPCPPPPPSSAPPPPRPTQPAKAQDLGQKLQSEPSGNDLASALSSVRLKKTADIEKSSVVESKPPPAAASGGDMMSEMAARLQKRKNMTDSKVEPEVSMPEKSNKSFVKDFSGTPPTIEPTKIQEKAPSFGGYKQQESSKSRPSLPKRDGSKLSSSSASTNPDWDSMKKDMMEFFKLELKKMKEEIIEEIKATR